MGRPFQGRHVPTTGLVDNDLRIRGPGTLGCQSGGGPRCRWEAGGGRRKIREFFRVYDLHGLHLEDDMWAFQARHEEARPAAAHLGPRVSRHPAVCSHTRRSGGRWRWVGARGKTGITILVLSGLMGTPAAPWIPGGGRRDLGGQSAPQWPQCPLWSSPGRRRQGRGQGRQAVAGECGRLPWAGALAQALTRGLWLPRLARGRWGGSPCSQGQQSLGRDIGAGRG